MDGIKQTLEAVRRHRSRTWCTISCSAPGRRWATSAGRSRVISSYFAPFNHKPTSTNIAVLELGEPEQLIEIQMFAVVD